MAEAAEGQVWIKTIQEILLFPAVDVELQSLFVSLLQLWALFIISFIISPVQQMAKPPSGVNTFCV